MSFENPFASSSASQKPERSKNDEKEYQNRMKLGPLWNKRKITTEILQARGVKLDLADMEEYSKRREEHQMMKGSEEAGFAEEVFLEGIDTGGMTKEKGEPYSWFGDSVVAYPAHPHDDVLRGTDAVLMFIDQEDERMGYPIAVDITTNRLKYDEKFRRDVSRVRGRGLSQVYWAETAGGSEEYFDDPKEGKLSALNLSVYLPKEAVSKFLYSQENASADGVMEKLGPFIRRQIQSELETQAMALLDLHPRDVRQLSQTGLLTMLEAPMSGERPKGFETARTILLKILPIVWERVRELGPLSHQREALLPQSIQERPPLRADWEKKEEAV